MLGGQKQLNTKRLKNYPYVFILLYALAYMGVAVYFTFIPVYLDKLGFSKTIVGVLLSVGPFITLLSQPVWGIAGDRAPNRNLIQRILILGSAVSVALYPVSSNFLYLLVIISVFTFFQSPLQPVQDSITLELLDSTRWKFGPIRMSGTIGYAIMSIVAGIVVKENIRSMFPLYMAINILALLVTFRIPKVKGYQSQGNRVSLLKLFEDREFFVLMALNFVAMITLGFYNSFFSIYYTQMGGDSARLGVAMFLSSMSEVPFLLFADRVVNKLRTKGTMITATAVMAVRWLLLYSITDANAIVWVNVLHGFSYISLSYAIVTYINTNVQKELRTSGQTMNGMIGGGFARIIGGTLGGFLSDVVGIRQVFLYAAITNLIAIAFFGTIFLKQARNKSADTKAADIS